MIRNIPQSSDKGFQKLFSLSEKLIRQALAQEDGWYFQCKPLLINWFALLALNGYLLPVRETLSGTDARKIDRYKTLISYMEQHCQEPLSLKDLSDVIGCSSQYLCRFFREIAGISPIQYLIALRINMPVPFFPVQNKRSQISPWTADLTISVTLFENSGSTKAVLPEITGNIPAVSLLLIHEKTDSGIRPVPAVLPQSAEAGYISRYALPGRVLRS